ncbi:MAG TPA: winged helix DNA-binding domain-containing protein [Actinomycetota bacterium]|nr:winged helix DNA-binding domain-containing protein [Actinomycetota bacterium]
MRTIGDEERRARLGVRHHLARPTTSAERAARDLAGLHSSDPVTVFLSAWARVEGFEPEHLERELYDRRSLVRMLGMRRTLFVVPTDLAGVMDEACTKALLPGQRKRLIAVLAEQAVTDEAEAWLDDVSSRTLAALEARGEASARELTADVPELATKLTFGEGKTWGGTIGLSTRVLFLLATAGLIVRARPLGRWTSGQYRWAPTDRWIEGGLPAVPHDEACAELLRRWLRAFGPATTTDVRWWTGWTAGLAASTLAAIEAVEVSLERDSGWVLPDDLEPVASAEPWIALLPALDATVMGWKQRDWYLGPHAGALFDRNGNAGPTVWADGRVVGGWGQADHGEIVTRLLEPVGRDAAAAIDAARVRLADWLGDVRIRPRFRTPLERELSPTRS